MSSPPQPLLLLLQLFCAVASQGARAADLAGHSYLSSVRGPQFGDWCDETDDCVVEDRHLECVNQKCVCRDGYEYRNEFCRRDRAAAPLAPALGQWCEESGDCEHLGAAGECRSALCECAHGHALLDGVCAAQEGAMEPALRGLLLQPGDKCEENEDCALTDKNLECRDRVCHCKEGHTLFDGLCRTPSSTARPQPSITTPPKVGVPCNATTDCTVLDANLECRNSRCECKDGHESDGGLCKPTPGDAVVPTTVRPSHLGDWCVDDSDCKGAGGNVECFGGVCLCKQGFLPNDGVCEEERRPITTQPTTRRPRPAKPPLLGEWCTDDLDCAHTDDNMECFSEVCLCRQGYVPREGLCKKEIVIRAPGGGEAGDPSLVGEPCEDSSDCPLEERLECRRGFCECLFGFVDHEGACRRKIDKIGAFCNSTTDVCYSEEDDGYVKVACVQGKCLCKQGFFLDSGRCKKHITELGARCHPDLHICFLEADGNDTKTECRDGTCQCRDGYEEVNGTCPVGNLGNVNNELGAKCQNDTRCASISHAKCSSTGKCVCREGYGPMNNRTCGKRVGDRCDNGVCDALNTQCTKKRSSSAEASVCACKKYHLSSSNRTYCYTWPQNVGDLCDESRNCMYLGDNVECIEGRCQCGQDFAHQDGLCVEKDGD